MATSAGEQTSGEQDGIAHRVEQRNANRLKSTAADLPTDAQGLVEFACECSSPDCERSLRVPLDVYRRMFAADQYLLQAGHHAFTNYRTIISAGLMRIEERA